MNYDKVIMDLIKGYNPMYKVEKIRVNVSSSFMARGRCKDCGELPSYYYYIRLPPIWGEPKTQFEVVAVMRKWIKRMGNDWYLEGQPRYFHSAHDFDFMIEGKSFNPKMNRVRGAYAGFGSHVLEVLSCSCGATVWHFNQKSIQRRPDIVNRKGKYAYPKKFEF